MPLSSPMNGENQNHFIPRCMRSDNYAMECFGR